MKKIKSTGISSGLALAKLKIVNNIKEAVSTVFTDADTEWGYFKDAQSKAVSQLMELAEKATSEVGKDMAMLFETHSMMAEDPDFEDMVSENIRENNLAAAVAVEKAGDELSAMLESMEDEYMKARGADIRDVMKRIINIINNVSDDDFKFDEPVIIAANDLSPSETLRIDKNFAYGFILFNGTSNGHTGILARNLGIPAVIKPDIEFTADMDGKQIYIDGTSGEIIIDPDEATLNDCKEKIKEYKEKLKDLQKYKNCPTKTKDGRSIKLYCNIGSCEDAQNVLENGGEGVGLFRSEFLYLKGNDYPTEDEQFEAYKNTLEILDGKDVIIRTCDIGSDKRIDYMNLPEEQNPALGTRALRLCLARRDMFKAQLRALYRASVYGKLSIMVPMIASVWEVEETKSLIEEIKGELRAENKPFSDDVKVGIMIETPAAAVISDELAKLVDFFSIGSNDLTQYTLACDRNSDLGRYFDPHHPAVLRLIRTVADNAHKEGIEVGICGELGADEALTDFFLDVGIDELSVSPKKVMSLRKRICEM